MALPVESFIVALREGDDLTPLKEKVGKRAILAVIASENERTLSSTAVKKALKQRKSINSMVSHPVIEIIEKYGLYR
jgi:nicotinic acid mononucleotide adenylyltransferase